MARNGKTNGSTPAPASEGITRISVAGFKSIRDEQSIEIRPLTILAGANSSGKSSIMQPLLLMKQTLEASYDPGALLLTGPNAYFTSTRQFLARSSAGTYTSVLDVAYETASHALSLIYQSVEHLDIVAMTATDGKGKLFLSNTMDEHKAVQEQLERYFGFGFGNYTDYDLAVFRNRCFLDVWLKRKDKPGNSPPHDTVVSDVIAPIRDGIQTTIHVSGVRTRPQRSYPVTAVGSAFAGLFETYTASVVEAWQTQESEKIAFLVRDLQVLGLAQAISVTRFNEAQLDLRVSRIAQSGSEFEDMVSIADVGIGVSHTLPVVVALHAAVPNQLVYIEQPELHLHPRAQVAMAKVLADAAIRGVRVVTETHSSLLLLAVQTLVAEGKLDPSLVALHWFSRDDDGNTKVDSADLDEAGAFGDWPEDFGDVELRSQSRYLDAAEERLAEMSTNGR